jgi:hypothetical protein
MERLVAAGRVVVDWITRVAGALTQLSSAEQAAVAVGLLFFAWQRLGKWFVAAGIVAILDDIAAWMADQPSILGKLLGPYQEFAASVADLVESLGGLENVIRGVVMLALAGWIFKVAGAAAALAASLGLVTAAGGAAGVAGGAARGGMLAGLASRFGPLGLAGAALGGGLFALDRATSTEEERAARPGEQAARGEALQDMGDGRAGWDPIADAIGRQGPGAFDPSGVTSGGLTVIPSQPIEDGLNDLRQYLDSLQGASIDVDQGSLMGDVDQSRTANINLNLSQSITVPPGTTSEQLSVIRRESEAAIERAADRAAAALEM